MGGIPRFAASIEHRLNVVRIEQVCSQYIRITTYLTVVTEASGVRAWWSAATVFLKMGSGRQFGLVVVHALAKLGQTWRLAMRGRQERANAIGTGADFQDAEGRNRAGEPSKSLAASRPRNYVHRADSFEIARYAAILDIEYLPRFVTFAVIVLRASELREEAA